MRGDSEDGSEVRNSLSVVTNALTDVRIQMATLNTNMTNLITRDGEDRQADAALALRVGALETWRAKMVGQMAVFGFMAGASFVAFVAALFAVLTRGIRLGP